MIEKILAKFDDNTLNRESVIFFNSCGIEFISVNKAKEIVQEVAKEYGDEYEMGFEDGAESVRALAPYEVLTQADRIRAMSDEELADYLSSLIRSTKVLEYFDDIESWLKWLKSEAKE